MLMWRGDRRPEDGMEDGMIGERARPLAQERERLECSCEPYVWDEEGENVVDYAGSCYCEAGADSRERVARERRAFDISLLGYALDEDCNHVDVDGKMIAEEDGEEESDASLSLRRMVESELKRLELHEQYLGGLSTDGSWE